MSELTARLREGTSDIHLRPYTGCAGCADQLMEDTAEKIETLFEAIKHGDEAHRVWLQAAIDAHFDSKPVPPYVAARAEPPKES